MTGAEPVGSIVVELPAGYGAVAPPVGTLDAKPEGKLEEKPPVG